MHIIFVFFSVRDVPIFRAQGKLLFSMQNVRFIYEVENTIRYSR